MSESLTIETILPDVSVTPSRPRSSVSFTGHRGQASHASTSLGISDVPEQSNKNLVINPLHSSPAPKTPRIRSSSTQPSTPTGDETAWGSNFWVTLVDPTTSTSFYACPATGQVSWDPPVGNFVLPPSTEGEWWELTDDSRGLPYYYQTKTGETVWERPDGFVIPLGILQNTALGRRLSQNRLPKQVQNELLNSNPSTSNQVQKKSSFRRSRSYADAIQGQNHNRSSQGPSRKSPAKGTDSIPIVDKKQSLQMRRSLTADQHHNGPSRTKGQQLTPIPGSPFASDGSSHKSVTLAPISAKSDGKLRESPNGKMGPGEYAETLPRSKSSPHVTHRAPPPQSLSAAVEMITSSQSDSGHGSSINHSTNGTVSSLHSQSSVPSTPTKEKGKRDMLPSPRRPIPAVPGGGNIKSGRSVSGPTVSGKEISGPILDHEATMNLSPVKNRANGKPIPVEPIRSPSSAMSTTSSSSSFRTGTYPVLPLDLASDIQQFSESDYARQYFSTHRTGFIFRRRVPVAQMMTWQKVPLHSPLLSVNRTLNKDAVKVFKVIQRIMGDRERDKAVGVRLQPDNHISIVASINGSTTSLPASTVGLLEEERWLLGEGLTHGELRDEIYCQLMKQLNKNPNPESVFKGWQLLCVLLITFPPSKNFEAYLRSFMQQCTSQQEGRVDVMAKYALRRLVVIAKKGPRGKPPTIAEIETASDAAFNPSTFGESLDGIIRLQERNYPHQKVPIILPFLADGILALGGSKSEGIFRVPGDGDSVSELKLRIDRGYYTLDGVDDPHVLASLLKLWLRELCDPLVPEEMYNECITSSEEPAACVRIVERLPTINRRVILFVISFLQLFLEDKIQSITKMTPANLALVMAPNLLRCNSESMAVVFTNSQYEQIFVYNLLLHLKCHEIDDNYVPTHGLGAVPPSSLPRTSKSRTRRQHH